MLTHSSPTERAQEALDFLAHAARDKSGELGDLVEDKYTDLRDAVQDISRGMQRRTRRTVRQATRLTAKGQKKVVKTAGMINENLHEHPWPFIGAVAGGALAAGFLLGLRKTHR